jgi:hypothetical protein
MGGKSRKGGGVSSKLISRLKAEQERSKSSGRKGVTNEKKNSTQDLFDDSGK